MISEHRAELLAERYRFNMGLLMGECGAWGSPRLALPAPPDPESAAMCCPGPSCSITVLQPT